MLKALKRALMAYRTEGHEGIETPGGEEARFILQYEDLSVGVLRLHNRTWEFRYTAAFVGQSEVQPLVDFPDLEKVYESDSLWPFFMARIPSLAQPQVRETIQQEGLDERSDVQLLKRFGQRTISNPFVLNPA